MLFVSTQCTSMTTEIIIVKIRIVAYYFIFLAGAEMAVQPVLII